MANSVQELGLKDWGEYIALKDWYAAKYPGYQRSNPWGSLTLAKKKQYAQEWSGSDVGVGAGGGPGVIQVGTENVPSAETPTIPEVNLPSWGQATKGMPAAPPYKPSPEVLAWQEKIGGHLEDILDQGGIGMDEKTKEQLYLREAETINASTAQAIKNLEDEMAAKGMSNSGLAFSERMKAQAKGTAALANVMRDVEIQDALMKLSSFENALAMSVQFVSYLSEESWKAYQPKLLEWEQKANLYRLSVQQAYEQQNMALAHYYNMEIAKFEKETMLEVTEMELEAANKQAASKGAGSIIGAIIGGIFGMS